MGDGPVFRAAVIGLGSIARQIYLPVFAETERLEMVVAMSRNPTSKVGLARRYNLGRLTASLDDVIKSRPDVAFVLTPKETHPEITTRLLAEGVDVFCEKPMATTLRAAERMVRAAEESGRVLMIGFNRRFAPVYARARAATRQRAVELCLAEKSRPQTEYRATLENAIHMVDLLRWFCGEVRDVTGYARFVDPYYETSVTAQLRFESGALGVLVANRSAGQWMERFEVHGGGETVVVDAPERVTVFEEDQKVAVEETPLKMGWADAAYRFGFRQAVDHFLDCVQERAKPVTSGEDSLLTHVLLDRILRSCGLPPLEHDGIGS